MALAREPLPRKKAVAQIDISRMFERDHVMDGRNLPCPPRPRDISEKFSCTRPNPMPSPEGSGWAQFKPGIENLERGGTDGRQCQSPLLRECSIGLPIPVIKRGQAEFRHLFQSLGKMQTITCHAGNWRSHRAHGEQNFGGTGQTVTPIGRQRQGEPDASHSRVRAMPSSNGI